MNIVLKGEDINYKVEELRGSVIKERKVVFLDTDSLLHQCAYRGKDEYGNTLAQYIEEEYPLAEAKLNERIFSVLNAIALKYDIVNHYLCIQGNRNFRFEVYPEYKANRPKPLPIIKHLCEYVEREHGAIPADGYEADDLVYTLSSKIEHKGIVAACDKDLKQIPGIYYDYNKDEWYDISQEQADYNLAMQIICGDSVDNVNFLRGIGPKKSQKYIHYGMSKISLIKGCLRAYQSIHKEEAKNILRIAYKVLKLRNMRNDK